MKSGGERPKNGSDKPREKGVSDLRPATAANMRPLSPDRIVLARPETDPRFQSDAAKTVALMKAALLSIGNGSAATSPDDIKELLPYFTGAKPLPSETTADAGGTQKIRLTEEGRHLRDKVALHQPALMAQHLSGIKGWLKEKKNRPEIQKTQRLSERWEAALASGDEKAKDAIMEEAHRGALVPLGIPYSPVGSGANDLPDVPQALWLMLQSDENLAHRARNAFILGLKGMSFKDTPTGKLCQTFLELFQERNKAHVDAHDMKMRTRFDNAAIALLTYGIVKPSVHRHEHRSGERAESVGFSLDTALLERHAEVFLAREQWKRLSKAQQSEQDPVRRQQITIELEALQEAKNDADAFVSNLKLRGISKPATIFETFGNRLYVPAADLPVFDTPQPDDETTGKSIGTRSFDAALRVIGTRRTVEPLGVLNKKLDIRAGQYKHVLDTEIKSFGSLQESVQMLEENPGESQKSIARTILREILAHVNNLQELSEACVAEMDKEGLSESGKKEREEKITPIKALADKTLETYSALMNRMIGVIAPKTASSEQLQAIEAQNTQLKGTFTAMLKQLQKLAEVDTRNVAKAAAVSKALGAVVGILNTVVTPDTAPTTDAPAPSPSAPEPAPRPASENVHETLRQVEFTNKLASEFFKSELRTYEGSMPGVAEVYERYVAWSQKKGDAPVDLPTFGRVFGTLGIEKKKIAGRTRYVNIALKDA